MGETRESSRVVQARAMAVLRAEEALVALAEATDRERVPAIPAQARGAAALPMGAAAAPTVASAPAARTAAAARGTKLLETGTGPRHRAVGSLAARRAESRLCSWCPRCSCFAVGPSAASACFGARVALRRARSDSDSLSAPELAGVSIAGILG